MSETFFVSDMHFGHNNIIEYCKRPFADVPAMNQGLIDNWNAAVGAEDTVYHLGDWAFHCYECISQLNGHIISVPGNHDLERKKKIEPFLAHGFVEELSYLKISPTRRFVLCHYPLEAWRREYQFHLHGHRHGQNERLIPNRMDVGIDATGLYRPIHIDEVVSKLVDSTLTSSDRLRRSETQTTRGETPCVIR